MAEVQPFTDKQRESFRKKFQKLSVDGETISKDDMLKLIQLVGQNTTKKQFNDALIECQLQSKLNYAYDDFEAMLWTVWTDQELEKELLTAFKKFDRNNDGTLDAEEFKNVMLNYGETLTQEELSNLMETVDINADGKIEYEEFIKAMVESTPDDDDDDDDEESNEFNKNEDTIAEINDNEEAANMNDEQDQNFDTHVNDYENSDNGENNDYGDERGDEDNHEFVGDEASSEQNQEETNDAGEN